MADNSYYDPKWGMFSPEGTAKVEELVQAINNSIAHVSRTHPEIEDTDVRDRIIEAMFPISPMTALLDSDDRT